MGDIGITKRRRPTKKPTLGAAEATPRPEATAEADLGRPPTMAELALDADNISERIKAAEAAATVENVTEGEVAYLEGVLASVVVVVNGMRVHLSRIRTQEHVGLLLAEATREKMETEAHYKAWRARHGVEIVIKAAKPVPDWRIRQLIEGMPDYLTFQTAIARATANVLALQAVWDTWGDV